MILEDLGTPDLHLNVKPAKISGGMGVGMPPVGGSRRSRYSDSRERSPSGRGDEDYYNDYYG
ncbi:hypothetical protein E2C01_055683 [Portunus trituberculatus]|uniref:Uncharacterized protein n=1 Tax=Portunus trituberculatus TaxID=210409 RepID=A0A5B7GVP2_PORTR|nr:hypothetical protein [Portunus trituberculatus]